MKSGACKIIIYEDLTRIRKSYRTYWLFSFHSDNWKKLASLQKLAIFNIYHIFAPILKLSGCRFLYFFSLWDVRNEAVFLILEHSSLRGLNRKNTRKNMKFCPLNSYYTRSNCKTWLAGRFSEVLTSKFWNKTKYMLLKLTEIERNWIVFTPYGFINNLWQIHLRDSHVKFMGKNKVSNTMWAKLCGLIGQKQQNSFQYTYIENFFVSVRQAGEQALGL